MTGVQSRTYGSQLMLSRCNSNQIHSFLSIWDSVIFCLGTVPYFFQNFAWECPLFVPYFYQRAALRAPADQWLIWAQSVEGRVG